MPVKMPELRLSILYKIMYTSIQIMISSILLFVVSVYQVGGKGLLTKTPPSVMYAFIGETVRFEWNYTVKDRNLTFGYYVSSPIWYYYSSGGDRSVIAVDDGLHDWYFKISYSTCPPRLLYPTVRVSKDSVATLVISNVTKSDSGIYEIYLVLRTSPSVTNRVQLVVTGEAVRFSKIPPSALFVAKGKIARFEWQYSYNNRNMEFQSESPAWGYVDQRNKWVTIATEKKNQSWRAILNTTSCPAGLLDPTRVYIEPPATLVILNVTMADSGTYGCSLRLKVAPSITSTVQLIVTEYPVISLSRQSTMMIQEGAELSVPCLSRGFPIADVTWVKVIRNDTFFMCKGLGNATLRIKKIDRNESGIYECYATNNPNEDAVKTIIEVVVLFVDQRFSYPNNLKHRYIVEGMDLRLLCSANGSLNPMNITYTWSYVDGTMKTNNNQEISSAELLIRNITRHQKGKYVCQATSEQNNIPMFANITVIVIVMYKPVIDKCLSSENIVPSYYDHTTYLRCVARGVPLPNVIWYGLNGENKTTPSPGESKLAMKDINGTIVYGIYRCRADNDAGVAWHNITVMKTCQCRSVYNNNQQSFDRSWTTKPWILGMWTTFTIVSAVSNILLLIYIRKQRRCQGTSVDTSKSCRSKKPLSDDISENILMGTEVQSNPSSVAMGDNNRLQTRNSAYERMDLFYAHVPDFAAARQKKPYYDHALVKENVDCPQREIVKRKLYQELCNVHKLLPYENLNPENREDTFSALHVTARPENYQKLALDDIRRDYETLEKNTKVSNTNQ